MNLVPSGEPPRILIVDDERQSAVLLAVILQSEGFTSAAASSGAEALRMVREYRPDLILLDILMPGLNGYQVATLLRANAATKGIPIIMLSVLGDREPRMLGLSAGADDFMTKPVDRAELSARVRNLLRLKAYADYHEKYSQMLETEVMARTVQLEERSASLEQQATAMRESEERTNFVLDSSRMGIWEVDISTQRVSWSDSMAQLYGLTPDQVPTTTETYFALVHPDDVPAVRANLADMENDAGLYETEFRILWPDGSVHWVAGRSRIERGPGGMPQRRLGVTTDIDARKLMESQLRQAQKMDAVGQLAGGVAHDFNNLLTAILGYAGFVMADLPAGDPRRADMEQVVLAGERATTLTRQLLAFSRQQVLQPTALRVNDVVRGMLSMLTRLIGEDIAMVPLLADDAGTVRADRGQLEQVLMNLVVNARDAMPTGGRITITTANVELGQAWDMATAITPGRYLVLTVSDNGDGMSEATKQRLFEPFFTTKGQGKGTGLGLATVYGIVQQSGGHIRVDSKLGRGATFKIYLPLVDPNAVDVSEGEVVVRATLPTPAATILLVEDENSVRKLVRTILERAGYQVYDAANPGQAETLFERHRDEIALVVTDVIMPGISGPKLYERLVGLKSGLKVLYISGYTDDAIFGPGNLDIGIDFLQKPFTAVALRRRVREILNRVSG